MTLRAKFCVIGTGAGGGILAYRLAKAGADVLVINSGGIPAQSEFENELSPEQKGHFEIGPHTTFPVRPEISIVHSLLADARSRSSIGMLHGKADSITTKFTTSMACRISGMGFA